MLMVKTNMGSYMCEFIELKKNNKTDLVQCRLSCLMFLSIDITGNFRKDWYNLVVFSCSLQYLT